jgi:hypothetical protein
MVKDEEKPYGYIYIATNCQTGKNYIGQTVTSRWKEEAGDAYRRERRGKKLRSVENAIIKYGPENFDLKEQDVAFSQEELDDKEIYYIEEFDSKKIKDINLNLILSNQINFGYL